MSEPIQSEVILGPAPNPYGEVILGQGINPLMFNNAILTTGHAITLVGPTAIPTGGLPQTITLTNSLANPFAAPITMVEGNTVETAPLLFSDDPQP